MAFIPIPPNPVIRPGRYCIRLNNATFSYSLIGICLNHQVEECTTLKGVFLMTTVPDFVVVDVTMCPSGSGVADAPQRLGIPTNLSNLRTHL